MVAVMDWSTALSDIHAVLRSDTRHSDKAVKVAEVIRQTGSYRWVGLYKVTDQEIARRVQKLGRAALSSQDRAKR